MCLIIQKFKKVFLCDVRIYERLHFLVCDCTKIIRCFLLNKGLEGHFYEMYFSIKDYIF